MKAKLRIVEKMAFNHLIEVKSDSRELPGKVYDCLSCNYGDLADILDILNHIDGIEVMDVYEDDIGQYCGNTVECIYDIPEQL